MQLYQLVYCELENPTKDLILNTTDEATLISNLHSNTPYTFLLRAFTSAGAGPWSNRIIVKTLPLGTFWVKGDICVG